MKFIKSTDTVDIAAKSIGVHTMESLDNRGLCIQIRHNGNKKLFDLANEIANKIVEALNEEKEECEYCGHVGTAKEREDCCDEAEAGGF